MCLNWASTDLWEPWGGNPQGDPAEFRRNDGPAVPSAMGLCHRRWYNRSPSTGTERECCNAPITSSADETHDTIIKRPWTQSTTPRTREEIWYTAELNTDRSMVTLHVVSSLDGFIAKNDNSVSWLDNFGEVYEAGVSEESADEVIEGSRLLCARFSHV